MIIRIKQFSKADEYYIVYYDSGKIKVYTKLPKTAQVFMESHKSNTFIYGTKVTPATITIWE